MRRGAPVTYTHLLIAPNRNHNLDGYRSGYVYLFRVGDLTKIGFSQTVRDRARTIQSDLGRDVQIILAFPCTYYASDRYWHTMFEDRRVCGEWFRLDTDDYLRILDYLADYPDHQLRLTHFRRKERAARERARDGAQQQQGV